MGPIGRDSNVVCSSGPAIAALLESPARPTMIRREGTRAPRTGLLQEKVPPLTCWVLVLRLVIPDGTRSHIANSGVAITADNCYSLRSKALNKFDVLTPPSRDCMGFRGTVRRMERHEIDAQLLLGKLHNDAPGCSMKNRKGAVAKANASFAPWVTAQNVALLEPELNTKVPLVRTSTEARVLSGMQSAGLAAGFLQTGHVYVVEQKALREELRAGRPVRQPFRTGLQEVRGSSSPCKCQYVVRSDTDV